MDTITHEADERQPDQTASTFLLLVLEYAAAIGLFALLESKVPMPMQRVIYSTLQKAQTVVASVAMGCAHTKAIDEMLGAEVAAARKLGPVRWPDQSQINRYLTRFTAANVDALGAVHALALRQRSRARGAAGPLVVDIDQCGLVANGKTYEPHRQAYVPRKRGVERHHLSLAYLGANE